MAQSRCIVGRYSERYRVFVDSRVVPELLRVGAGFALVLVLPGLSVLLALRVRLTIVEWLALVPACSLGAVYVLAELTMVARVPFGPVTFFIMVATLAIAALVRLRLGWSPPVVDRGGVGNDSRRGHRASVLTALGLLLVAIVIGSTTWLLPMRWNATTAPGSDAFVHGFMITRIVDTESISPRDVLVTDASGRDQAAEYYPLSLHSSLALQHRITGASIGHLLNAVIVLFAALVLPLSVFALSRFLIPEEPLVAGFAAVIGSLITIFPYKTISWGLIPLMAAMSLVPITVLLLIRTIHTDWSRAAAVLSGLVVASVFALHNSEVPLIVGLVAVSLLFGLKRRVPWRDIVTRLLWIGLVAAVLLAPTWHQLAAGGGERDVDRVSGTVGLTGFLGRLLTLGVSVPQRQGWLVALAVAGVAVLLWRRELTGWIIGAAVIGGLAVLAATSYNPITNALTLPWYRLADRVSYNIVFFVPVFAGALLGFGARWIAQHVSSKAIAVPVVVIIVLGLLYPITAARALRANRNMVSESYTSEAPVREANVAAFEYIRAHSRPPDSVLSDLYIDGAMWMYPLAGANPVLGITPEGKLLNRSWTDRLYLRDHIGELGENERVDEIVHRLRVRFVYFGEEAMKQLGPHGLTLEILRSSPHLHEVFDQDGAHVFAITLPD
jgi:hypothetical protein